MTIAPDSPHATNNPWPSLDPRPRFRSVALGLLVSSTLLPGCTLEDEPDGCNNISGGTLPVAWMPFLLLFGLVSYRRRI